MARLRNSQSITPYEAHERLLIIQQHFGVPYKDLATLCKCSLATIYKDIRRWAREGGFEEFLLEQFAELHSIVRNESPETAYRIVAMMLAKTIANRVSIDQTITIGVQYSDYLREKFGIGRKEVVDAEYTAVGEPAGEPGQAQ